MFIKYSNLQEMLIDCLEHNETKISFRGDYGIKEYTYHEILYKVQAMAQRLSQLGVGPGDYVILQMPSTMHYYLSLLTLLYMKAIPMAVPYCSNSEQYHRLCQIIETEPEAFILTDQMGLSFIKVHGEVKGKQLICLEDEVFNERPVHQTLLDEKFYKTPSQKVAMVQYSSGTTSRPKGIEITHRGLLAQAVSVTKVAACKGHEAWMSWLPLTHILGLAVFTILPIYNDYPVAYMEPALFLQNPKAWFDELERVQAEITIGPNFAFKYITDAIGDEDYWDLSKVRIVFNGSEPISKSILSKFKEKTKPFGLRQDCIYPGYGLTETTCACAVNPHYEETHIDFEKLKTGIDFPLSSIKNIVEDLTNLGPAMEGAEIRIVDDQYQPLEAYTIGNIQVTGDFLCAGYKDADDHELFTNGWLNTGDIGFLIDGELYIVGRKKDMLFLGGRNIFLIDLEYILQKEYNVRAAVCGEFIAEEAMPRIYVFIEKVPQNLEKFKKEVSSLLRRAMGINVTDVMCLEKLATTTSGKVDKQALMKLYNSSDSIKACLEEIFKMPLDESTPLIDILEDSIHTFKKLGLINEAFHLQLGMLDIMKCQDVKELIKTIENKEELPAKTKQVITPATALTSIQEAYLLGRQQEYYGAYNATHFYVEIQHDLDLNRIEDSLYELIKRHPILHTIFKDNKQQVLPIEEISRYRIPVIYVREEDKAYYFNQYRKDNQQKIYDPEKWPLFTVQNINVGKENILCIDIDMLITDGFSAWLLMRDFMAIYNGDTLPTLQADFSQYVGLLEARKKTKQYQEDQKFWLDKIPTFPEYPKIPVNNSCQSSCNLFNRLQHPFNVAEYEKLSQYARQNAVTPSIVLGYLYAYTLSKWAQDSDFAINVTLFDRPDDLEGIQEVVGDFTSSILLDIHQDALLRPELEALTAFKNKLYEYYDHHYFEGSQVIREMIRTHKIKDNNIMPVVFTSMFFDQDIDLNLMGKMQYAQSQTSQVMLDNQIIKSKEGFTVRWDYLKKVFPEGVIEDMFNYYIKLIEAVFNEEPISSVPVGSEDAVYQYNHSPANATDSSLMTLSELFNQSFIKYKDRIAITSIGEGMTYRDLDQKTRKLITYLKEKGASVQTNVLVKVHDKAKAAVIAVAIVRMGAVYIPVPFDYPKERMVYIEKQSQSQLVLDADLVYDRVEQYEAATDPIEGASLEDAAYTIYTSGSTGTPKGVVISHEGVMNTITAINQLMTITENAKVIGISGFNFDLSCYDIFGTLAAGASVTFISDPREMGEIEKAILSGGTVWNSVPAIMEMFLNHLEEDFVDTRLERVLLSGDWISLQIKDKIKKHFPNAQVYSLGGATEASIWSIYYKIEHISKQWISIPYGYPLAHQTIYVLDETLKCCPFDKIGEIYIGGLGVAKGYLNDPEKTSQAFIETAQYGRLYKTGDQGIFRRDGYVDFLGRKDDQVKIRGYRIELNEIRTKLLENKVIQDSIVVVDQNQHLIAYYVADEKIAAKDLQDHLRNSLPDYMIPHQFIKIDKIPLTYNGKVDYKKLKEAKASLETKKAPTVTTSRLEKILMKVWCQVLELDEVRRDDDFFELGGDSLSAQKISQILDKDYQLKITINQIIKEGTIHNICALLEEDSMEQEIRPSGQLFTYQELMKLQDKRYDEIGGRRLRFDTPEYYEFKKGVLNRHRDLGSTQLLLNKNEEAIPLYIKNRRTIREFDSKKKISFQQFSDLLLMLSSTDQGTHYYYPSSGGLYAIDLYLYVKSGRVENVDQGFYHYDPINHALQKVQREKYPDELCHYFNNRKIYMQSAFSMFLVYDMSCNMPFYGALGNYNALVDAGVIAAQMSMAASFNQIGCCLIGDMEFEKTKELMGLKASQHIVHDIEFGIAKEKDETSTVFPQTEIQTAYIKGKNKGFELGKYDAHYYMEMETLFAAQDIEKAINQLIQRHSLLRTVFNEKDNTQIIKEASFYPIEVTKVGEEEWQQQVEKLRKTYSSYTYEKDKWPLFTFKMIESPRKRLLMISMSLLICDGASLQIFIRELWEILNHQDDLQVLTYSFGEYAKALEEASLINREKYEADKAYWKQKIENFPESPRLLFDKPLSQLKDYEVQRVTSVIDQKVWMQLKKKSQEKRLSASTILCTLFGKVLSMWSNQKDLAIDLTVFQRLPFHEDVQKLIGDFTKLIPLDISFQKTITETARLVQNNVLEGIEHLDYAGTKVMQELAKRNEKTGKAILPIVFTSMLFDAPVNYFKKLGRITYAVSQTPQVYLDCQVMELEGELHISWDYVTQLFKPEVITQMFQDFNDLIKQFRFDDIKSTMPKHILSAWEGYNQNPCELAPKTLLSYLQQAAFDYPDHIALAGHEKSYTYQEVDQLSNQVARYLCSQGICGSHARVCVLAERKPETIITIWGILKTGAAYVPVSLDFPKERQQYICKECECHMLLDTSIYEEDVLYNMEDTPIGICPQPDWLAYIIYTSGSTGKPKGVMITHKAACNTIDDVNEMIGLNHEDCTIGLSSLCFDLSVYDIFGTTSAGAKLALVKDPRNMGDILGCLVNQKVTVWNSVPAILSALCTHLQHHQTKLMLRQILLSGDQIPINLPQYAKDTIGDVKLMSLGGATEAAIWSIYYPIDQVKPEFKSIPYGYPMKNQKMYVLGYDQTLCVPGVTGEIYIGGEGLAVGYVNDIEKTSKAFIDTPQYGRLYRTGDLGIYHSQGYIEIVGRIDHQVKIRGYRIELAEIEIALQKNEKIKEAVAAAIDNEKNRKVLAAYIVLKDNSVFDQQALTKELEELLPKYMVPSQFVVMNELPHTANGKIDRKKLPKPHLEMETAIQEEGAMTKIEEALIKIWEKEFQTEGISVNDNFFALGGDSIIMMKMVESIFEVFKVNVEIEDILECDNIKGLAAMLGEKYQVS